MFAFLAMALFACGFYHRFQPVVFFVCFLASQSNFSMYILLGSYFKTLLCIYMILLLLPKRCYLEEALYLFILTNWFFVLWEVGQSLNILTSSTSPCCCISSYQCAIIWVILIFLLFCMLYTCDENCQSSVCCLCSMLMAVIEIKLEKPKKTRLM